MLLNVPRIIPPELLVLLDQMGHTDEIILADSNFPAVTMAKHCAVEKPIYMKGVTIPELLDAVLTMIPLDYREEKSVIGVKPPENEGEIPVHAEYPKVLAKHGYGAERLMFLTKPEFYARAEHAYCVVVTGESARFANMIVRKGVI